MEQKFNKETLCVQAGWTPKKGEPRVLPIYQSTTFKYDTSEQMARLFDLEDSGYFYTRLQNPTNDAVAAKIAALEGGVGAMLTSSGQAANFYAVFNICEAGDHFVCSSTIYGGTFNLFAVTMKKLGIECTFIDADAPEEEIEKAFRPNTKCLFGETISNPGINVIDIEKFARIARSEFLKLMRQKREIVELDSKLANRSVNEGFSGGEKKRNEIFQMAMLEPKLSILDETDSGLDIDALRIVAEGVNKLKTPETSCIVITHYQRLLDYIKPDIVHVLYKGRIVKTAGPELALELEEKGYDWIKKELGE